MIKVESVEVFSVIPKKTPRKWLNPWMILAGWNSFCDKKRCIGSMKHHRRLKKWLKKRNREY